MKDESIKIEIEDQVSDAKNIDEIAEETKECIVEHDDAQNVKGDNYMENENNCFIKDINVEKLAETNEEMDLFFILDKSGSMYGSQRDTINGYNAFIEKQLANNRNIRVTTVLFDDGYRVLYSRKPICEVKPLTERDYHPSGCTALLDAIGRTVSSFEREVNKAMCVINTDGLENSSIEYSRDQIKNMVESSGWEFVFIGADIDSYGEASRIGIRRNRTANYKKTSEGIHHMYDAVDVVLNHCINDIELDEEWKENLE